MIAAKPYIKRLQFKGEVDAFPNEYPFTIPAIKKLEEIDFHPNVTFIIGENGTGKSTLIEAIAVAYGFNAEGGTVNNIFTTHETHSPLFEQIKIIRSFERPSDGYFLRAETFYNLASNVDEIGNVRGYGGKSLHQQSHGEAFISTLLNKLLGHGLYILDEPEAALSPNRQLWALGAIHRLVEARSQFIIATHSPILLAYPNAKIYELSENGIEQVNYEETSHYLISKSFLENREGYLKQLLNPLP